jgi:hypothetical protein
LFGKFPFLGKLFADGGYQGQKFREAQKKALPGLATGATPLLDSIDPNDKCWSKGLSRLRGGTDKISNREAPRCSDAIAVPSHAASLLDEVFSREPQILIDTLPHIIGVEMDGSKHWRKRRRKRCLSRTR